MTGPTSAILGTGNIKAIEAQVPPLLGAEYGVAVASGTMALRTALLAVGVRPGDEVAVPAYDWIAARNAVLSIGAVPSLVDITLPDCTMSPDALAAAITSRTTCVVVTHLGGLPADVRAIGAVCVRYGIPLVEDAAQALGAQLDDVPVGSTGQMTITSFGPGKVVDAGSGGMVVTQDRAQWQAAVAHSQHPARQRLAGLAEPNLEVLEARIDPDAARRVLFALDHLDVTLTHRRHRQQVAEAGARAIGRVELPTILERAAGIGGGVPVLVPPGERLADLADFGVRAVVPDGLLLVDDEATAPNAARIGDEVVVLVPADAATPTPINNNTKEKAK